MKNWLALAILLLPFAARADTAATARQFAAVMQDPSHRQMVRQAAEATPAWAHLGCAAAKFTQAPEIGVYQPIVFDRKGQPVAGTWREGLIASGCGAPITLNVLTAVTAPSHLTTGYLMPGSTIADPVLQNAAQAYAVKAAGGIPPGCTDGYVANTQFAGYDGPDAAKQMGPWKEVWTLSLCGPPRRIDIDFLVDATSTVIQARPATGK